MGLLIRAITDDELPTFNASEARVFGEQPSAEGLAETRLVYEPGRSHAAFVDGELVGTANAYSFGLTVPGGADADAGLAVAGVSDVTVAPTHRRRGILRAMMTVQLDDAAARGEPMAVLDASEAAIYRRFGFGLAQSYQSWQIDPHRTSFRESVGDGIALRRVDREEAHRVLPPMYDAWRRQQPGALTHSPNWWRLVLGPRNRWQGGGDLFVVVAEPGTVDGRPHDGGFVIYLLDTSGSSDPSDDHIVHVRNIIAVDDTVRARLWRFALELDLATSVVCENVPLDDPLRWWLTDTRQVKTIKVRDYLYVRILDVPAVLTARRYDHDGTIVLDVGDGFRPSVAGRWRLTQRDGEVTCTPSAEAPDLRLDVAELGTLYLGGFTARELARTGQIEASGEEALRTADELFRWPVAPYCVTRF